MNLNEKIKGLEETVPVSKKHQKLLEKFAKVVAKMTESGLIRWQGGRYGPTFNISMFLLTEPGSFNPVDLSDAYVNVGVGDGGFSLKGGKKTDTMTITGESAQAIANSVISAMEK